MRKWALWKKRTSRRSFAYTEFEFHRRATTTGASSYTTKAETIYDTTIASDAVIKQLKYLTISVRGYTFWVNEFYSKYHTSDIFLVKIWTPHLSSALILDQNRMSLVPHLDIWLNWTLRSFAGAKSRQWIHFPLWTARRWLLSACKFIDHWLRGFWTKPTTYWQATYEVIVSKLLFSNVCNAC